MNEFLTPWSVGLDRQVEAAERDPDGYPTVEALGAWLNGAIDAYLDQCAALHRQASVEGRRIVRRSSRQPRPSLIGKPTDVFVTASATEVRPAEFFISVRVRPYGDDIDLPITITCRVSIEDTETGEPLPLDPEVIDEIKALERSAEHMS